MIKKHIVGGDTNIGRDGKPAYLKNVNKFETVDIKNIKFVANKVTATALYGKQWVNGAVLIETKWRKKGNNIIVFLWLENNLQPLLPRSVS